MSTQEEVRLLTKDEVADVFRITPELVDQLITQGIIPAIDLGEAGGYRIVFQDLKQFIDQRKAQAEQIALVRGQQAELESKGLWGLCNWLKTEKTELARLYRELSSALDKTAQLLFEELNSAQRSGDHSKARGIQEALAILQGRWEEPRNNYSSWVLRSQERWERALGTTVQEIGAEVPLLNTPWQADLVGNLMREGKANGLELPPKHRQIEAELKLYREMAQWFQQEIRSLHLCYGQLEQAVAKTVKNLKSKTKKASKQMDFARSQLLSQATNNLYHEWEKARSSYNHWLEGQEERWQQFKRELLSVE